MYLLFIWMHWVLVVIQDLVHDQGSNLDPMHWECWVLATGPPGKSPQHLFQLVILTVLVRAVDDPLTWPLSLVTVKPL